MLAITPFVIIFFQRKNALYLYFPIQKKSFYSLCVYIYIISRKIEHGAHEKHVRERLWSRYGMVKKGMGGWGCVRDAVIYLGWASKWQSGRRLSPLALLVSFDRREMI